MAIRRKREIPLLTAAVSFAAVSLVLAWIVVDHYGGASFFPGLAAGFLGTFVGFVLALTADRERERRRAMSEAADLMAQRQTEVRRRLQSVRAELVRLDEMIGPLVKELQDEVADLVDRVGQQIDQPSVQPLGLVHVKTGVIGARVSTSATIDTDVIRRDE